MEKAIFNLVFNRKKKLKEEEERLVQAKDSFTSYMKKEIENSTLKESTSKNHLSTLQLLVRYKENVMFQDFNYEFLCDFEEFLLKQKYNRNTITKHMKHLKRYLNQAINKEIYNPVRDPFRKYKMKYQESRRVHLTPEELSKIENTDLDKRPSLKRCRDMFLFSCYTGLRFSDVIRLKRENFSLIDNKIWLIYSSFKTDVHVRIPLSLVFGGKAIPIYRQYYKNEKNLFPVAASSNSTINKQLRVICALAAINKNVTSHSARHTHATLLLYNGANITTVQKLLGHKSVQTTQIYSNIMDMTIIRDLEKIGESWLK